MPLKNPTSRPKHALTLSRQQTWQDLLSQAEQIFALCSEQTEALFFEDTLLEDCQIVFKPHRMHSVASGQKPQKNSGRNENWEAQAKQTSMEAAIKQFYARPDQSPSGSESLSAGRLPSESELLSESGLVQRLDYETAGLLLRAPDRERQQRLCELQKAHKIKKFYLAWSPFDPAEHFAEQTSPQVLNSYFCSYGPKGRQVRILTADELAKQKGKKRKVLLYQTTIEAWRPCCDKRDKQKGCIFLISLQQGFRHQVRAQLADLGFPLCCDPLYSASSSALPSHSKQPPDGSDTPQPYPRLGLIACGFELCGQRVSISII